MYDVEQCTTSKTEVKLPFVISTREGVLLISLLLRIYMSMLIDHLKFKFEIRL